MGANAIGWFGLGQAVLLLSGNEVTGGVRAQCGSSGDRFQTLSWPSKSLLMASHGPSLQTSPTPSLLSGERIHKQFLPNHLML